MRNLWSKWYGFDANGKITEINNNIYGIYKIRAVSKSGLAIKIPRIGGTDEEGILYIGRSGFRRNNRYRSISKRISEFYVGNHSGDWTAELSYEYCLSKQKKFKNYKYEVRILQVQDIAIEKMEADELSAYFKKYGELPPYNSSFPHRLKFKLEKTR